MCCEQALAALQHLPENRDMLEQAIDLRFDPLRHALWQLGEHRRVLNHLREAETIAAALADQWRLGWALSYMTNGFWLISDHDRALASGQRALVITSTLKDFALQLQTNLSLAQVYHALGDYRRATDLLKSNVASLEGELLWERFGQAGLPSVLSRSYLTWCLAERGEFAEGITCGEEGIRVAEAVDQPYELLCAYRGIGLVYLRKGDLHKAVSTLERCYELCQIVPGWSSLIASFLGYAYTLLGRMTEAIPLLKESLEQTAAVRFMVGQALWVAHLSEGYLLAGHIEDVTELALRALQLSRDHQERGYQAYALRLLGEIAAQHNPPDVEQAEAHYRQALALAEELGMQPLVAHCHLGLGKLSAKIGRRAEARTELPAAVELYRAMEMTFWLPQAEVTLAQVERQ